MDEDVAVIVLGVVCAPLSFGHFPRSRGKPFCPYALGIPCDLASLARVPLRFAKGRASLSPSCKEGQNLAFSLFEDLDGVG